MLFSELLKLDFFRQPYNQPNGVAFRDFVKNKLQEYLELLNTLDPNDLKKANSRTSKSALIKNQEEFVKDLLNTIEKYYEGYPEAAFVSLKSAMEKRIMRYEKLLRISTYKIQSDFFRIRVISDNNHLSSNSFFHIPFEYRGKVSSQRFSIPGFPSLYLGRSIYICWEELNRPNLNDFYTIRFQSKAKIKVLDLAPPFFQSNLYHLFYYKFLISWPLIFLCTIRVKNFSDVFKPEYIVPQLLLQWIRENKDIDGIQYWSTHVKQDPTIFKGEYYNIVLPVKENKDKGLCKSLSDKFEATEVVSWQLHEFALSGGDFLPLSTDVVKIDSKMESLELIEDMKYPYSYSAFGQLELYLSTLKTKEIKSNN